MTGGDRAAAPDWQQCLSQFAAHLQMQRDALAAGEPWRVAPFPAPAMPGPVPHTLHEQARALLESAQRLQQQVADAHDDIARQLRLVRRMEAGGTEATGRFEQHV